MSFNIVRIQVGFRRAERKRRNNVLRTEEQSRALKALHLIPILSGCPASSRGLWFGDLVLTEESLLFPHGRIFVSLILWPELL